MDPPSSNTRSYPDPSMSRPWSPPTRLTVSTSISNHVARSAPSDHSPLPSSLPNPAQSSPWSQNTALNPSQSQSLYIVPQSSPRSAVSINSSDSTSLQSFANSDWSQLFPHSLTQSPFPSHSSAAHLNSISSAGAPSSLPVDSFRSNVAANRTHGGSNTNMPPPSRNTAQSSWTTSTSAYSGATSYAPQSSQPRSSVAPFNTASLSKGKKSTGGLSHFAPIQPRQSDPANPVSDRTTSERQSLIADASARREGARNPSGLQSNGLTSGYPAMSAYLNEATPSSHGQLFEMPLSNNLTHSQLNYLQTYSCPPTRTDPSSLWMSPASTAPSPTTYDPISQVPLSPYSALPDTKPSGLSVSGRPATGSPTVDSKAAIFSNIFAEDLLVDPPGSRRDTSPFTSPVMSRLPDLQLPGESGTDPDALAKNDPLATQVWKMYARTKATLPHQQRMENLTWRMMALALKKKRDEEARMEQISSVSAHQPSQAPEAPPPASSVRDSDERGRRIDKGKTQVRVVGFDGTNQDGVEDEE